FFGVECCGYFIERARGERLVEKRHQFRAVLAPNAAIGEARVVDEMLDLQRTCELRPILLALPLQQANPMTATGLEIVDQRIGRVLAWTVRGDAPACVLDREIARAGIVRSAQQ